MYVITYLNSVVLGYGLFKTLEDVERWKENFITERPDDYVPQPVAVNEGHNRTVYLPNGVDFKYSNPR